MHQTPVYSFPCVPPTTTTRSIFLLLLPQEDDEDDDDDAVAAVEKTLLTVENETTETKKLDHTKRNDEGILCVFFNGCGSQEVQSLYKLRLSLYLASKLTQAAGVLLLYRTILVPYKPIQRLSQRSAARCNSLHFTF